MARNTKITFLRTTRANLTTQGGLSNLFQGEPYFITDESRLAIGLSVSNTVSLALKAEVDAKENTITVLPTSKGGLGVALTDPNADRIMFWDDSAGEHAYLTLGTGLSITGTTINVSAYVPGGTDVALADGGTGASLSDPNADRIMFWDDSAGAVTWLSTGSNLTITNTSIAVSGLATVATTGSASDLASGTLPTARGGLGIGLTDPGADRIIFWDDSVGVHTYLSVDGSLTLSGTTLSITAASTSEVRAVSGAHAITPTGISDALAFVTATYGATTTISMTAGPNQRCTLTGNITSFTLSNVVVGATIEVEVLGNDATARTITFHSNFKGDLPTLNDITSTKGYALVIKAMTSTQWNVVSRRSL